MNGIVKSFNNERAFGFLDPLIGKPDIAQPVFFHISAVKTKVPPPVGAEVKFDLVRGKQGPNGEPRHQAANIELVRVNGSELLGPHATKESK